MPIKAGNLLASTVKRPFRPSAGRCPAARYALYLLVFTSILRILGTASTSYNGVSY